MGRPLSTWAQARRPAGLFGMTAALGVLLIAATAIGTDRLAEGVTAGDGIAMLDHPMASFIAAHRSGALTTVMQAVSSAGSPPILAAVMVVAGVLLGVLRRSLGPGCDKATERQGCNTTENTTPCGGAPMNGSVHMLSEVMAGSMTTGDGAADVAVRLTYKPRDPHALIVTITERAGEVQIWTIGRDLLLSGLIAQPSRPAGMNRIRLWTCQHHDGPSLMTSFVAFLELELQNVADFAIATLQLMPQGEEPGQLDIDAELRVSLQVAPFWGEATADMARIRGRLRKLGGQYRHWTQSADRPATG